MTFSHPELKKEIEAEKQTIVFQPNDIIIDFNKPIRFLPIVKKGAIKVMRQDENGDLLFLYYLKENQTCAVTLECCKGTRLSHVRAVAEEETEIMALPLSSIERWMSKYGEWRQFILNTYAERFNELLQTIDSICFKQLDERLWDYLIDKRTIHKSKTLHISHQQIAQDLHTSREVVSRLLKQLEKIGRVQLSRNKIQLV